MGVEGVEHADRGAPRNAKLSHVAVPRALDTRAVRELEAWAALDQGVDHLRHGALVTDVETVPPRAELVRDFDVGGLGGHQGQLLRPPVAVGAGPAGPRRGRQPDISRSMATISFSTRWMSASISSSGRGRAVLVEVAVGARARSRPVARGLEVQQALANGRWHVPDRLRGVMPSAHRAPGRRATSRGTRRRPARSGRRSPCGRAGRRAAPRSRRPCRPAAGSGSSRRRCGPGS